MVYITCASSGSERTYSVTGHTVVTLYTAVDPQTSLSVCFVNQALSLQPRAERRAMALVAMRDAVGRLLG